MSVDQRWYLDVNSFARHTPWLHDALAAYALWGGLTVLALMLLAAYLVVRRRPQGPREVATVVCVGLGAVAAVLINQQLISPAVARPRPCATLPHVEVLLSCAHDYSFPSDHTMIAGAFVAGLAFLGARWALPAAGVALLLAFGRVYTGVHYPGDAAAGLVIGAVIGAVVVLALRPAVTRLADVLAGTRMRRLVGGTAADRPPVAEGAWRR